MASEPQNIDQDPLETQEWIEALDSVIRSDGKERAAYLLNRLAVKMGSKGVGGALNTPYVNTIAPEDEVHKPREDDEISRKVSVLIRWNAVAMILHAGKRAAELGGHIASYASAATLYDVGFNYFFQSPTEDHGGDLVYLQGHSSPGVYARAFLEGRLSEEQLNNFRQEVEKKGLSSYPHPWLMPDFWQFPTVSMGLGPIQGIYNARFLKYLHNRELLDTSNRHVWVFCGDGEMDEPESCGALSLASREKLDNLIFVINCNLQRLDGPVRGNSSVIQELEVVFLGAGWNVIKVMWGRGWDPLFAKDKNGLLAKRMAEAVDGDYQNYKAHDGAYVREHFFGKYPELKEMVAHMTDDEIWKLARGGHDSFKVHAAYHKAVNHKGQPTVILAKTIKGFGMGAAGQGLNITHQQKKMGPDDLKAFCKRFNIPIPEDQIPDAPFYRPPEDSPEIQYLKQKREALGGNFPVRRLQASKQLSIPGLHTLASFLKDTGTREISTTMVFVRILNQLLKDKHLGRHIVPIIPDEGRTFGMEGMFRQYGIYSSAGQRYTPVDAKQVMYYREDVKGQILEEGINEAGAFCSWIAAATSYSVNDLAMIPFYTFYSMFGFQRVGDLAWLAGDIRARGFLIGGTSGRTTLAGEGLQHQDGHSHVMAAAIPNCIAYDPTFSYELAVIIQSGLKRMYANMESVFYYITVMNENYHHPEMPQDAEEGIIKGMYLFREGNGDSENGENDNNDESSLRVRLLGSGAILCEVIKAANLLKKDFGIGSDIWSVTSFNELCKEGRSVERYNRMHPGDEPMLSYVEQCLKDRKGPVIAATDYIKAYSEQIRDFVPGSYTTLGTDGFGRSDTRKALRHFFEVDAKFIVHAALYALLEQGQIKPALVRKAMKKYGIKRSKSNPELV
ncbi:MAG: pyruvate dehydrogenase (acetyl-transferring), homodimeric type [bacterium]|nr:pyruvate dehydrogenase (acetyl-transferring), homodimeric type [bacterium]